MTQRVLLIVGGGIAAYRALEVARLLRHEGFAVTPVMTQAAGAFITPLSLEVLCGEPVHDALFAPTQESAIDHIALARSADLVLVCPATANLMARMAHGLADDLATTLLLATTAPIFLAPAMNVQMWLHPATRANLALLHQRNVHVVGPESGEMACGEHGPGRLSLPEDIVEAVRRHLFLKRDLEGRRILVTAGPTVEPLDPVRFLSNQSSGRQGFAIAEALAMRGAEVHLVSGPVTLHTPAHVHRIDVQTAEQMKDACLAVLPVDVAICAAAVSDWRLARPSAEKIKKTGKKPPTLTLLENPDILTLLCQHVSRPALVIGFAAETEKLLEHAEEKRLRKECDWLLVNDVSSNEKGESVFGAARNRVCFLDGQSVDSWPEMDKKALAHRLADRIAAFFNTSRKKTPRRKGKRQ